MRVLRGVLFALAALAGAVAFAQAAPPVFNGNLRAVTFPWADGAAYGAKCDGTTDDTTAIQNAINTAEAAGIAIRLPSGVCVISSQITIGNGTSSAYSTYNSTGIFGAGSGFFSDHQAFTPATILRWNGAGTGPMLNVQGPITSINLSGLMLDCANKCTTGIQMTSMSNSLVTDVYTENNLVSGSTPAWLVTAYCNAPGGGAQRNTFINFGVYDNSENDGLTMMTVGANTVAGCTNYYDVSNDTFINVTLAGYGTTTDTGLAINFADNELWERGIIATQNNKGVSLNVVPGYTTFPQAIFFETVGVDGASVNGTTALAGLSAMAKFTNWIGGTPPPQGQQVYTDNAIEQRMYPVVSVQVTASPSPLPSPCGLSQNGGTLCLNDSNAGAARIYMGTGTNNALLDFNHTQAGVLNSSVNFSAPQFFLNTANPVLTNSSGSVIMKPPGVGGWTYLYSQAGSQWAVINGNGGAFTGSVIGGQPTAATCTSGDGCFSRSATTGALNLGGSTTNGLLDFGVTNASQFTFSTGAYFTGPVFLNGTSGGGGSQTDIYKNAAGAMFLNVPTGQSLNFAINSAVSGFLNSSGVLGSIGGMQPNGGSGGYAPEYFPLGLKSAHPQVVTGSCSVTAPSTACTFPTSFAFSDTTFICPSLSIEGATPQNAPTYDTKTTTGITIHVTSSATVDYSCAR